MLLIKELIYFLMGSYSILLFHRIVKISRFSCSVKRAIFFAFRCKQINKNNDFSQFLCKLLLTDEISWVLLCLFFILHKKYQKTNEITRDMYCWLTMIYLFDRKSACLWIQFYESFKISWKNSSKKLFAIMFIKNRKHIGGCHLKTWRWRHCVNNNAAINKIFKLKYGIL